MFESVDSTDDLIELINEYYNDNFSLEIPFLNNVATCLISRFPNEIEDFKDKLMIYKKDKKHNLAQNFHTVIKIAQGILPKDILDEFLNEIIKVTKRSNLADKFSNDNVGMIVDKIWFLVNYIENPIPELMKIKLHKQLLSLVKHGTNDVKKKCVRFIKVTCGSKITNTDELIYHIFNFEVFRGGSVNWELLDELLIYSEFNIKDLTTKQHNIKLLYSIDWGITLEKLENLGKNRSNSLFQIIANKLPNPEEISECIYRLIYQFISTHALINDSSFDFGINLIREYEIQFPRSITMWFHDSKELEKLQYPFDYMVIFNLSQSIIKKIYFPIVNYSSQLMPDLKSLLVEILEWEWELKDKLSLISLLLSGVYSTNGTNEEYEEFVERSIIDNLTDEFSGLNYPIPDYNNLPSNQKHFTKLGRMSLCITLKRIEKEISLKDFRPMKQLLLTKYPSLLNYIGDIKKANHELIFALEQTYEFFIEHHDRINKDEFRILNFLKQSGIRTNYFLAHRLKYWDSLIETYNINRRKSIKSNFLKYLKSAGLSEFTNCSSEVEFLLKFMQNADHWKHYCKIKIESTNPFVENDKSYDFGFIDLNNQPKLLVEVYTPRDQERDRNIVWRHGILYDRSEDNLSLRNYINKILAKKIKHEDPQIPVVLALNINQNINGLKSGQFSQLDFSVLMEEYRSFEYITGFLIMHSYKDLELVSHFIENPYAKYKVGDWMRDTFNSMSQVNPEIAFDFDLLIE